MEMSRALFALVSASTLIAVAPWACSSDPAPANPTGQGGSATGLGSAGNPGTGGGEPTACTGDCPLQCNASAVSPSLGDCVQLGGPIECNPVTNEGCNDIALSVCDWSPTGFKCYGGDNTQQLCQECTPGGKQCQQGLTCVGAWDACAKFCCTDADCDPGGNCVIAVFGVGTCQGGSATTSSSSSASSSGMSSSSSGVNGGMGGTPNGGMGGVLNGVGGGGGNGGN